METGALQLSWFSLVVIQLSVTMHQRTKRRKR